MKKSRQTKRALIPSILAVILCVAMLIGTTFAWFTDTASTSVNKIEAGKLDVALYYGNDADSTKVTEWIELTDESAPLSFLQKDSDGKVAQSDSILWEPGCTYSLPALKIVNNGNLALRYQIQISGIKGSQKLNEAIEWTMKLDGTDETLGSEHKLAAKADGMDEGDYIDTFTISGHMKEDAGNEYQGLSIEGIAITVSAAQDTVEYDSTGNQYDKAATLPATASATGNLNLTDDSSTAAGDTATVKVAAAEDGSSQTLSDSVMSVTYPANTVLKKSGITISEGDDGSKRTTVKQELTYVGDTASASMSGVSVGTDQAVSSYTLDLPVDDSNNTFVEVVINYTAGLTGVTPYHNGNELKEKSGDLTPSDTDRTEYFTYDSTSGKLTLYVYNASPIDIVYDKPGTATVTTQAELNAAIANSEIKTIKLGADWTGDIKVNGANGVTLDFNGYTVSGGRMYIGATTSNDTYAKASTLTLMDSKGTGGVKTTAFSAIWMNGSDLTIKSGTYESTYVNGTDNAVIYASHSKLTIDGGYFHNGATSGTMHHIIKCRQLNGRPTTLVINGGKFEGPSANCGLDYVIKAIETNKADGNNSVTINGGEFYTYTSNAYLAKGYSDVTVNNCTFVYESTNKSWTNNVFNLETGFTLTVKGGTFTVNGKDVLISTWSK